ncbi:hypothetical protein E3N88_21599 [Mikania micrantha]|uniref:Replication factor A C-terminal domain-containing protein n=1 Tax=Mikania micrantha TaxID=192012 RepID=A0A5N6NAM6_9ASTR|nr:hypothetical protein E3N88_21599 [Mikania micrantha]
MMVAPVLVTGKIAINKTKKIMSFKHISDISAGDSPEPLEIRVLKKWVPFVGKTEKKPEICYLFVDMHGHAIEAAADLSREKDFDSIIDVGSCYMVNNYVAIPCRSYMPAVPHQASLRIGKRATFTPLLNENLPTHYYNFATYIDLPTRMEFPKRLTGFPFIDYIGRVEYVSRIMVRAGKILRKIAIQDDRRNHIEITLWGEKAKSPGIEDAVGSVLAVSSTTVTEFKDLGEPSRQQTIDKYVTIAELKATVTSDNLQARLACFATIVEIQTNRNWFYVTCSEPACPHKAYPQSNTYVCEDHGILSQPMFMYCVNATIQDNTAATNVVIFNEAMTNILDISCKDMVVIHGNKNPKVLPFQIENLKGQQKLFHMGIKKDGSIFVNKAHDSSVLTPATPDPKRHMHAFAGSSGKKPKQ